MLQLYENRPAELPIPMQFPAAANLLRSEGVSKNAPITRSEALKFRGIAETKLRYLQQLGLVRPDEPNPFADLPVQTQSLLRRVGFKSRREVAVAIATGELALEHGNSVWRRENEEWHLVNNCGAETFHQIRVWAGYTPESTYQRGRITRKVAELRRLLRQHQEQRPNHSKELAPILTPLAEDIATMTGTPTP